MTSGILVLEDGVTFAGTGIGRSGTAVGEVVFSTAMTGYQEMLTDPSYAGQLLTLTYPLIGNYGITEADFESHRVQVAGFLVKQLCDVPSHWRSGGDLDAFLRQHGVVGLQGIDTRALTRHLRSRGVMMGVITTEVARDEALQSLRSMPSYSSVDFVRQVSTPEPYVWKAEPSGDFGFRISDFGLGTSEPDTMHRIERIGPTELPHPTHAAHPVKVSESEIRNPKSEIRNPLRVTLVDCGVKFNIMRQLAAFGCETTVVPCDTPAEAILERDPDGIAFSPGPGDPAHLGYVVETARKLIGKKPIFGICLGNQILGCAFGATTFKLPFGHRGGNHPVKDLRTGRVYITSQNHGYAVDPSGLDAAGVEVTHVNLNDGTVEGIRHRELPIFTIQYHPEASPGPEDSRYLFEQFVAAMKSS